jgi:hypothetical protein
MDTFLSNLSITLDTFFDILKNIISQLRPNLKREGQRRRGRETDGVAWGRRDVN